MTLEEFSSVQDQGLLVNEFFHCYGSFIQSYQLYPPNSSKMQQVLADLRAVLNKWFEWRNPISITIMRERLYFEEFLIKSNLSLVTRLIDIMLERLVRKIVINKRVEDFELLALAELFNISPVQLRDIGGPEVMLADDRNVENISVSELSMFFSEQISEADSWQSVIQKTGLDVDEVSLFMQGPDKPGYLVDVDKAGRMSVRGTRLSRNEIFQLMEILLNPSILAKMILDLSTVPTDEGPMIDPSEIVRIVTRTENTLIFRSSYPSKVIDEKITDALQLLDGNLRVAILAECLHQRKSGQRIANMDIYKFAPEEWCRAILGFKKEKEEEDCLKQFKFSQEEWESIGPSLIKLYPEIIGDGGDPVKFAKTFHRLKINPDHFKLSTNEYSEIVSKVKQLNAQEPAQKKLSDLKARLKKHIEIGYANTVLGLLQVQGDDRRVHQITNNFFSQIHELIEKEHLEAIDFLNRFQEIMQLKVEKNPKLIANWMENEGQEFMYKILHSISNIQIEKNFEALQKLLPILNQFGIKAIRDMLEECYFNNRYSDVGKTASLISEIKTDIVTVLESYLDESQENFSPRRFFKSMSLYLSLQGEESEPLVRKCMNSETASVRKATLLGMLYSRNKALAIPIFREVLKDENKKYLLDEQIIAAYSLGSLKDHESIDQLKAFVEKSKLFSKGAPKELSLAALYSYAGLKDSEARNDLDKLYKKIMRTGISSLFPWKPRDDKEGAK